MGVVYILENNLKREMVLHFVCYTGPVACCVWEVQKEKEEERKVAERIRLMNCPYKFVQSGHYRQWNREKSRVLVSKVLSCPLFIYFYSFPFLTAN